MILIVRALAGLIVAFIARGVLTTAFQQTIGRPMRAAAGLPPGAPPPVAYVGVVIVAAVLAAVIAGAVAALVVRKARIRHALVYGALFTGLALWANRGTLFSGPHPEEWPLILAPLVAMPIGAWLVVRMKPPQPSAAV